MTASANSPAPASQHVFVIVMENSSVSEALSGNFVESLASKYAMLTDYHSVGSPSLPNYLALTSGSTWAVADDGYHVLPPDDIGHQLTAAGKSWRAYMDAMTGDCFSSPYPYAVKHNPFAYYGGACPPNVVPLTQLQRGLAAGAPAFTWITPDMCHDGHDCGKDQSDGWLAATVPQILASSAWRDGGVLFVVWDESDAGPSDTVPALVVAPNIRVHSSARYHDHYSLLATIEDRLGLSRLGAAKQATPITEVFSG